MQEREEIFPDGVELHDFTDHAHWRQKIFDDVKSSVSSSFPKVYGNIRMEVSDLDYTGPENFSLSEQKKALLENKFLGRKLKGRLRLYDNETDELLDEQDKVLMNVPYLTQRGTFIHNGSEYVSLRQNRLLPGVYAREKNNGDLEAQFNVQKGTGTAFRIRLEPETAIYRLDMGQSSLKLYSILKELGVDDNYLKEAWGPEIFEINEAAYDKRDLAKAYSHFLGRRANRDATHEEMVEAIRSAIQNSVVDGDVVRRTLPTYFDRKR